MERSFFKKILSVIPGTDTHDRAKAVHELYTQHYLDPKNLEESTRRVMQMLTPLAKKQEEILERNKKKIFARIAELDSQGAHELDLKQYLPDLERFWSEDVITATDKDHAAYLKNSGAVWFALQTKTWTHETYQYNGGIVTWLPGAPNLEIALHGVNE